MLRWRKNKDIGKRLHRVTLNKPRAWLVALLFLIPLEYTPAVKEIEFTEVAGDVLRSRNTFAIELLFYGFLRTPRGSTDLRRRRQENLVK